ncbi:TPA: hypothetical protein QHO11_000045 [Klebsiella oxytoca]|uniref:hypothetical protein n=1 Tax=Enterobacter cloacae TaxID=550 RepID=UPI0027FAD31D|nr:hypothetical protein [Klebsiella oxytoca]
MVIKNCTVLALPAVIKNCTALAQPTVIKDCVVLPLATDKSKFHHLVIWFSIVLLPLAEDYLNPD